MICFDAKKEAGSGASGERLGSAYEIGAGPAQVGRVGGTDMNAADPRILGLEPVVVGGGPADLLFERIIRGGGHATAASIQQFSSRAFE